MAPWYGDYRYRGTWEPMPWYGGDESWTVVSRKSLGKGKHKVWSKADWASWNAKSASQLQLNPKQKLDSIVKALGDLGKTHKTFLETRNSSQRGKSPTLRRRKDVGGRACLTDSSLGTSTKRTGRLPRAREPKGFPDQRNRKIATVGSAQERA